MSCFLLSLLYVVVSNAKSLADDSDDGNMLLIPSRQYFQAIPMISDPISQNRLYRSCVKVTQLLMAPQLTKFRFRLSLVRSLPLMWLLVCGLGFLMMSFTPALAGLPKIDYSFFIAIDLAHLMGKIKDVRLPSNRKLYQQEIHSCPQAMHHSVSACQVKSFDQRFGAVAYGSTRILF